MEVDKAVSKAHVLAVGLPAQGHVKPLMKLCRQIAKHGIKVTFANLQSIHDTIVAAAKLCGGEQDGDLILVPVADTRSAEERADNLDMDTIRRTMRPSLTELIQKINGSDDRITCVIADVTCDWVLEMAQNVGAQPIAYSTCSAATMAVVFRIPMLLEQGMFDEYGNVKKGKTISLSDDIPPCGEDEVAWSFPSNREKQKFFFEYGTRKEYHERISLSKWVLFNTCYELEPACCDLNPNFLPVGPVLSTSSDGNFYPEDASCLKWLDSKPPGSVIYVSFGSIAVFSQQQLDELALGLELSGRAFLWVVRQGLANGSEAVYPDGFLERVGEMGKIVGWAPQERVLSHPSVGCFLSHCGWNSTLEGVSKGVRFLCWPYFADQFHNQSYICDNWEVGLRISPDENGIRSRSEIEKKIEMVFAKDNLRINALELKKKCAKSISEGGSSYQNLKTFVDHLKKSAG